MVGNGNVYEKAIDRGLEGVVACSTHISSIVDATLTYRGYKIEDLAQHCSFEEVVYLLWYGQLPTHAEKQQFQDKLVPFISLDSHFIELLKKLPYKNVHPMAWLRTAVSSLALTDPSADDLSQIHEKAYRLTAKMGLLVATFQRIRSGQDVVSPQPDKSLAWNFLYCLKGQEPDSQVTNVFDVCLTLHADHELNCSSFATRVTSSALSDVYSAVVSGIGTLKGPLHGGANEQVMRMLKSIQTVEKAKEWITNALAQKQKIMGFGHRVYKNGDPRAQILKKMSQALCQTRQDQPNWFEISSTIEDIVYREKKLFPNVDFYSASVYYSMGIPLDLYTPIFATSRISGWMAHILEQHTNNRIYRPRALYVGKIHNTLKR